MNELTRLMVEYRQCLKIIWNGYLATEADWDDRNYFCNAAVELFRAMVLHIFDDKERNTIILPAYRGDKTPFMPIRVKSNISEDIRVSTDGTFSAVKYLSLDVPLEQIDMRYIDLYDFYELGLREFNYVYAEIVKSPITTQVGTRVLLPFKNAWFDRS